MSNWPEPSFLDYQQWADDMTVVDDIQTNVIELEDADISNPPEWVTWYPINDPSASWNLPK